MGDTASTLTFLLVTHLAMTCETNFISIVTNCILLSMEQVDGLACGGSHALRPPTKIMLPVQLHRCHQCKCDLRHAAGPPLYRQCNVYRCSQVTRCGLRTPEHFLGSVPPDTSKVSFQLIPLYKQFTLRLTLPFVPTCELPLFRTASNEKLGGAWEQGYP